MSLHLLITTVFALMIYETTPTANPQLAYPYQLPFFVPYYHPAPVPYYQPASHQELTALGFYFRRYFDPYLSQEQNYYGFDELADYRQANNPHFNLFSRVCPTAATISPCTCQRKKNPDNILVVYGAISCPEGQTAATIQQILGRISAGLNIKTVTLKLNRGATVANSVPAAFTSNYPKATISIVNPTDPNQCIDSTLLAPCTCSQSTTTCPSGTTVAEIQAVYSKIAPKTNLGNVVLNFPAASLTTIPTSLLGTNAATTIELIGPNTVNKSILLITSEAFTAAASTVTQFKMTNFDIFGMDFGFLANFNVLTTIEINNCANAPTVAKQPTNLPKNLSKLTAINVNGVNIYKPNGG